MKQRNLFLQRSARLIAMAVIALPGSWSATCANSAVRTGNARHRNRHNRSSIRYPRYDTTDCNSPTQGAYILGPGDAVVVELLDVPEYSGVFTIGPDGNIYLPRCAPFWWRGSQLKIAEIPYPAVQCLCARTPGICDSGRLPAGPRLRRW